MDIENMHPFCLPFGLCHDATSSAAADFAPGQPPPPPPARPEEEGAHNMEEEDEAGLIRISSQSQSPALADFYSLELEAGAGPDTSLFAGYLDELDELGELGGPTETNDHHHDHHHDWYCDQFGPLSPPAPLSLHQRRKSLLRAATQLMSGHHQVFHHHHVDIDIKSSPTLAQLNLNSQEEPAGEGLWSSGGGGGGGGGGLCAPSSAHSQLAARSAETQTNSHIDLLSNCTSISINHRHLPGAHHHHHLNQFEQGRANYQAGHHHHCHHSQQPYRKPELAQFSAGCCLLATASPQSPSPSVLPFGRPPTQHQHQHHQHQHQQQQHLEEQKRSASPALVTSSSSPLSSSTSAGSLLVGQRPATLTQQQHQNQNQPQPENRLVDNKLKENIEYLTALLCNGSSKLPQDGQQPPPPHHQLQLQHQHQHQHQQQQQQTQQQPHQNQHQHQHQQQHQQQQQQLHLQPSSISTTMARPSTTYATLAHSLSTGPKLLERHQQPATIGHRPTTAAIGGPNEAACGQDQQQQQGLKRPYQAADQWRPVAAVESSVSAADSTAEGPQAAALNQRQPELKVLSSLLSANKQPPYSAAPAWQDSPRAAPGGYQGHQNQVVVVVGPNNQAQASGTANTDQHSIPASGKPITLTPIASSIVTQQKPRFAQPASPSASSTGSSVETIGSSSMAAAAAAAKRPKPQQAASQLAAAKQHQQQAGNQANNRLGRQNSMSTECSQSSSHDEGFSSQMDQDECGSARDSDDDDDEADSDDESFYGDYTNSDLIGASISDNADNKWTLNMGRTRRNGQKRYFWQYNVQSKGPKGARMCSSDDPQDPFVLPEASDPVFSNDCQVEGVKHSGKARKGDGNDLTPNPRKLLMIGLELKKLGKIINELAPVTDLPVNVRNKTRKEKNKLASRACRLKKKAQHEANKIKLYGLQREHQQVVLAIYDIRKLLNASLAELDASNKLATSPSNFNNNHNHNHNHNNQQKSTATSAAAKTIAEQCSMTVAGQTSDYVNSVLEKVVSGCIDGGLQT